MAKTLEAGKLIVGAVAVYVDPTGTAATALGIDTIQQIKVWFGKTPDIVQLSKELDRAFAAELKKPRYDKPDTARTLLPQMLEAVALDRDGAVASNLDADAIFAAMVETAKAKDSEYDNIALLNSFEDLVLPFLKVACDDPRLEAAIRPALTRKQMKAQDETNHKLEAVPAQVLELLKQNGLVGAGADGATVAELQALAAKFEEKELNDANALISFLTQKAEEYRAYKSLIDGLDERVAAIANLKGAAQDAAARLDFDEVEALLSRVDEVETTIAAETKEARASNALLRNRPDQAYAIFSTAADAFRELDVLQYARRRNSYWERLYNHGLRYGGPGLALACDMIRPAIAALANTDHQEDWAAYTQNLAIALDTRGERTAGPEGAALLAEAVQAYRDALTLFTRDDHPVDWAMTQQNLAIALSNQGSRTAGPEGAALLSQAMQAYRDALTVSTRDDHPVDWAMTQQNLAGALQTQGSRTAGPEGAALLAEAVQAYRDALTVFTRDDHPVQWAMTQENMAIAEQAIADHDSTADPAPHLRAALDHVDAAVTVYDPDHMPYDHGTATKLRDRLRDRLNALR